MPQWGGVQCRSVSVWKQQWLSTVASVVEKEEELGKCCFGSSFSSKAVGQKEGHQRELGGLCELLGRRKVVVQEKDGVRCQAEQRWRILQARTSNRDGGCATAMWLFLMVSNRHRCEGASGRGEKLYEGEGREGKERPPDGEARV